MLSLVVDKGYWVGFVFNKVLYNPVVEIMVRNIFTVMLANFSTYTNHNYEYLILLYCSYWYDPLVKVLLKNSAL